MLVNVVGARVPSSPPSRMSWLCTSVQGWAKSFLATGLLIGLSVYAAFALVAVLGKTSGIGSIATESIAA